MSRLRFSAKTRNMPVRQLRACPMIDFLMLLACVLTRLFRSRARLEAEIWLHRSALRSEDCPCQLGAVHIGTDPKCHHVAMPTAFGCIAHVLARNFSRLVAIKHAIRGFRS